MTPNSNAIVRINNLKAPLSWDASSGQVKLDGTLTPSTDFTSREAAQLAGVQPGQQYWFTSTTFTKLSTVREATPTAHNNFGRGVALNATGTLAAISIQSGDTGGADCGSVEIHSISAAGVFTKLYTIQSPAGVAGGLFGYTVSLSADGARLAVGERYTGATGVSNAGRVHLYTVGASSATLQSTYYNPLSVANELYNRVALSGDGKTLAIGNPASGTSYRGSVDIVDVTLLGAPKAIGRVFGFNWLPAPNSFGMYCSLNYAGTELIVAANLNKYDVVNITSKSPFTFTRQWNVTSPTLAGSLPGSYEGATLLQYPVSVSSSGATLVSGSQPSTGGEICVSTRVGEALTTVVSRFRDPAAVAGDAFGGSVAISGDGTRVLVGAHNDPTTAIGAGTVYLYALNVSRQLRTMDDVPTNNAVSEAGGFVPNVGGTATLDNITVTATGAGNAFTLKTVSGTLTYDISGWCTHGANADSQFASSRAGLTMSTTAAHPFAWAASGSKGNSYELTIIDRTNNKVYSVLGMVGDATNLALLKIKRIQG